MVGLEMEDTEEESTEMEGTGLEMFLTNLPVR